MPFVRIPLKTFQTPYKALQIVDVNFASHVSRVFVVVVFQFTLHSQELLIPETWVHSSHQAPAETPSAMTGIWESDQTCVVAIYRSDITNTKQVRLVMNYADRGSWQAFEGLKVERRVKGKFLLGADCTTETRVLRERRWRCVQSIHDGFIWHYILWYQPDLTRIRNCQTINRIWNKSVYICLCSVHINCVFINTKMYIYRYIGNI